MQVFFTVNYNLHVILRPYKVSLGVLSMLLLDVVGYCALSLYSAYSVNNAASFKLKQNLLANLHWSCELFHQLVTFLYNLKLI